EALQKSGANISLGGMLALLMYEGQGRLAHYNTRCSENSYDKSAECWTNPKARYSYQLGLGAVHTSNFHPCRPPGGHPIRKHFEDIARAESFAPTDEQLTS